MARFLTLDDTPGMYLVGTRYVWKRRSLIIPMLHSSFLCLSGHVHRKCALKKRIRAFVSLWYACVAGHSLVSEYQNPDARANTSTTHSSNGCLSARGHSVGSTSALDCALVPSPLIALCPQPHCSVTVVKYLDIADAPNDHYSFHDASHPNHSLRPQARIQVRDSACVRPEDASSEAQKR